MMEHELSAAHNWCDRRCERCPLADVCPVGLAADRPVEEVLQETADLIESVLREAGIDPEAPVDLPPPTLDQRVIGDALHAWAGAASAVLGKDLRIIVISGKVGRVASFANEDALVLRAADTVPNLIVLEHLLDDLRADVDRLRPTADASKLDALDARERTLRGLLAPMFAWITAADRALISTLAAHGRAPSPFSLRSPSAPSTRTAGSA